MLIQLIVTAGTVAGILVIGLLAIIPSLLDYTSGLPDRTLVPRGHAVRSGEVAIEGHRRA